MYECKQAVFRGEIWTADQLKKEDGNYNQDLRLSMKKESQGHAFYCPECGENLILCAGNIREPYFRHYDGSECVLAEHDKAERYYAQLACMEDLVKKSFPHARITHNGVVAERMRSQLLVETEAAVYALNYASDSVNLAWLQQKMKIMNECGVVPVWFTIQKENKRRTPTTVEYAVSKFQPVLKSIIPKQRLIILKEYDQTGNKLLLSETYYLEDMFLGEAGEFICDFEKRKQRIIELWKERECMGRVVAVSMFGQLTEHTRPDIENAVLHISDSAVDVPINAVYMNSLEEFWVPMKLMGEPESRKKADEIRNNFLYYVDLQIGRLDRENNEKLITMALQILKQKRQSDDWIKAARFENR